MSEFDRYVSGLIQTSMINAELQSMRLMLEHYGEMIELEAQQQASKIRSGLYEVNDE